MSITYKCNLCGETIDRDAPLVILNSDGERSANQWRSGWIGHYHADPAIGCWQRILDIIRAADGWAPRLDAIPEFRSWWARGRALSDRNPLWVLGFRGL